MQKIDFSKSFVLEEGVNKISVVDNQIKTSYNDNNLELSVYLKVELFYDDKEDLKEFEVKLDPIPLKYKYFTSLKHELNSCDCVLDNNNLNVNGNIMLSRQEEEEVCDFEMPLKDKLYQSLLDFRNKEKQEVEIITTIDDNDYLEESINDEDIVSIDQDNDDQGELNDLEDDYEELLDNEIEISPENIIIEVPNYNDIQAKKEIINKEKPLLRENYVSSYFFYRVNKNETIEDILKRFNLSRNDFYKYNQNKEYKENDLIQIVKR